MTFEQRFKGSGGLIQYNNNRNGEKCSYFGVFKGRLMRFVDKWIRI